MCLICDRIEMIRRGENPYFVRELKTGYVVIGDHQHFRGYTLFLYKGHGDKTELFHLIEYHFNPVADQTHTTPSLPRKIRFACRNAKTAPRRKSLFA